MFIIRVLGTLIHHKGKSSSVLSLGFSMQPLPCAYSSVNGHAQAFTPHRIHSAYTGIYNLYNAMKKVNEAHSSFPWEYLNSLITSHCLGLQVLGWFIFILKFFIPHN